MLEAELEGASVRAMRALSATTRKPPVTHVLGVMTLRWSKLRAS